MQKARSQARPKTPSDRLSAHGFRIYFTRHLACFSPFPHGTSALSVIEEYLGLEGGPPRFAQNSTCSALLGIPLGAVRVSVTGLSPSLAGHSRPLHPGVVHPMSWSHNPARSKLPRFGLFPVRSPLLGESRLISVPPGTEMFQFPGLASLARMTEPRRSPGFPIRASWDHSSCAAPPGLSQLITPFIASRCQGIHRVPYCV